MAQGRERSLSRVEVVGGWSPKWLEELARQTGATIRQRKKDIWLLVWVLAFGTPLGLERTLRGLHEMYNRHAAQTVTFSSFYDWLNTGLAEMLRQMCLDAIARRCDDLAVPEGMMAQFSEMLALDASILRLHDALAAVFPGTATPAAAKLHLVINVLSGGVSHLRLTGATTSDGTPYKRLGDWVCGRLLLFDLGYYDFHFFHRIHHKGGFFLSRVKTNANFVVVEAPPPLPGQRPLVGQRLKDVLRTDKSDLLDLKVEVPVKLRKYRGRRRTVVQVWRLVAMWRPEGGHFVYLTNLSEEAVCADDLPVLYTLRWQVELVFKALKSAFSIDEVPSHKQEVVEVLIWSSLLAALLSQNLHRYLRDLVPPDRHLPPLRWAKVFARNARDIFDVLIDNHPHLARRLLRTLLRDAPDPNRSRDDRSILQVPIPRQTTSILENQAQAAA